VASTGVNTNMSGTPEAPEVTFHRNIRGKYPRGWADFEDPETLDRCDLTHRNGALRTLVVPHTMAVVVGQSE
jgi:hypothetical protein